MHYEVKKVVLGFEPMTYKHPKASVLPTTAQRPGMATVDAYAP